MTTVTDGLFTTVVVPPSALSASSWNKFVYRDVLKRMVSRLREPPRGCQRKLSDSVMHMDARWL